MYFFKLQKSTKVSAILEQVFCHLNVVDVKFFGLRFCDKKQHTVGNRKWVWTVFKLSKNIFVKFSVIVSELVGYFQDSVTTSQPAYVSLFSIFDLPFQIVSFLFLFCKNLADHEPLLKTHFLSSWLSWASVHFLFRCQILCQRSGEAQRWRNTVKVDEYLAVKNVFFSVFSLVSFLCSLWCQTSVLPAASSGHSQEMSPRPLLPQTSTLRSDDARWRHNFRTFTLFYQFNGGWWHYVNECVRTNVQQQLVYKQNIKYI